MKILSLKRVRLLGFEDGNRWIVRYYLDRALVERVGCTESQQTRIDAVELHLCG